MPKDSATIYPFSSFLGARAFGKTGRMIEVFVSDLCRLPGESGFIAFPKERLAREFERYYWFLRQVEKSPECPCWFSVYTPYRIKEIKIIEDGFDYALRMERIERYVERPSGFCIVAHRK